MTVKKITQQPLQNEEMSHRVIFGNCRETLSDLTDEVDLTFLDPPFNQQKDYISCSDNLPESEYWENMREVCANVFDELNSINSDKILNKVIYYEYKKSYTASESK